VPSVLLVSDARTVLDDLRAALEDGETEIRELFSGAAVREEVAGDPPDLLVTDFQVGSMGAVAICLDLRLEESGARLPHVPVLMLLDRRADVFLAKRSSAEGYVVKPLDPIRVRRAAQSLLAGGTFNDESFRPLPIAGEPAPV
jgi:DNA-binding response OmpR family regulator